MLPNAEVLTKDDNEKNCVNQRLGGNKVISWNTQLHESEVQTNPEHNTESNAFESKLTSSYEDKYPKSDEWTKQQHRSITPFFNKSNGLLHPQHACLYMPLQFLGRGQGYSPLSNRAPAINR
jgi:hypothetical protein